jgi:hypothetical protein
VKPNLCYRKSKLGAGYGEERGLTWSGRRILESMTKCQGIAGYPGEAFARIGHVRFLIKEKYQHRDSTV